MTTSLSPRPPRLAPAVWMWSDPAAAAALGSRDLASVLRAYRAASGLSQEALAALLGYDKSYVAMIETRKRTPGDVAGRRHIARALGLPFHLFGVTDPDDADFAALVQFGDSVVRLAEIARQSGRAVEAVNELWPLAARLEARAAEGRLERDTLSLLASARLALGVSLGTVLPEERLTGAAAWTGKALVLARHLGDNDFLADTLRMHGNELRKAGRLRAAVARLERAAAVSTTAAGHGAALALLARAAGDAGLPDQFAGAIDGCRRRLDSASGTELLLNPFTLREIHARGLLALNRPRDALRVFDSVAGEPAAPQWQVIERVTAGEVLAATGERAGAEEALSTAIATAEQRRLPHQLQRAVRAAQHGHLPAIAEAGRLALQRLRGLLSPAA
ncbi:transcriptional regulator with XRE-family HTH domain/predicted negative regulator of RcsB-dependent stress response [Amycolatopsis lexingtonensis]|uniref:Transcriptional regulator with XRE-family HTH domain/predicted negative regulator of RcsB-dependent stress response n=1 Tax=Amycolatopsis lexingtonensis TaxID=218822 RepID=A0ABR9HZC6_9PSEU|nr:helix-turn-helix transcriptional regulator [Amycolatopsis lexingtonensis]MBE1496291.1 transcriptional regulator with XRE-family HTH domain/predicted negative regulator of RcsB-dependent stress response [Amycolatopsis lexingtonensis]